MPEPNSEPNEVPVAPDEATGEAVGKVVAAFETIEQARGHLYAFHQLTGNADFALDEAVEALEKAGHPEWARLIESDLIGRNVLPQRWTFQVVEEYDDGYYRTFRDLVRELTDGLTGGRRHLYEESVKRRRRTDGLEGHEQGRPST